jgi:hypothetical protein
MVIDHTALQLRSNRHTGSTIEAMMITTLFALDFTRKAKVIFGTNTMHKGIRHVFPIGSIAKLCHFVILNSQFTLTTIGALQCTVWNGTFTIFTMRSIMIRSTSTRPMRFFHPLFLTVPSIDTKDVIRFIATSYGHWNFTILSYMLDTMLVNGVIAIAKVLIIAKPILDTWNALSTIVALVVFIFTTNIGSTTLETRLSIRTITPPTILGNNLLYGE